MLTKRPHGRTRTGLAPGKTPLAVELALERRVPPGYRLHAHHWLILHGRYTCKARRPDCPSCILADLCRYPAKVMAEGPAAVTPKAKAGGKAKGGSRPAAGRKRSVGRQAS